MRKTIVMNLALPALVVIGLNAMTTKLHASFIQLGRTNYVQNFDSLNISGKSKTLPNGWFLMSQDGQINADDGSSSQADIYSYGKTGSNNRALGTLTSGGNQPFFGVEFQNAGAGAINRLNISYTGEEWRLGAAGLRNQLQFQYSLNATTFADSKATWITMPSLSFMTPNLNGAGAHDGTLAANQVPVSSSISFLNIPQGGFIWLRWTEVLSPGNKVGDGLAIDNFSINAVPEASTGLAACGALGLIGVSFWNKRLFNFNRA